MTLSVRVRDHDSGSDVEVLITPQALMDLPLRLAMPALRLAEIEWANSHLMRQVREDVMEFVVTSFGPVKKLSLVIDQARWLSTKCDAQIDGRFHWALDLICDECNGNGSLMAIGRRKEHEAVCDCCSGTGQVASFALYTDDIGLFVDWDMAGWMMRGDVDRHFDPLPADEARALSRWMNS